MPATILLRRGLAPGLPPDGTLAESEPALDTSAGAPKLAIGLGGQTVVLADPAYVATLEARILALEQVVRELQYLSWNSALLSKPLP